MSRKETAIELRDRDGVMPYNAETFTKAIKGTREYLRYLLSNYPAEAPLTDAAALNLQSTARAFEPLDWLLEEAVITDTEKGGAA